MGTADQIYNRFVDAWNAGERPDVDDYIAQTQRDERTQFLEMVSLFLENAATPPLNDEQRQEVRSRPAYQRAAALAGAERGLWSTLLQRLREKAKLTREQLVAQLAAQLGVASEEERVRVYYHQMESGQLDPAGVSQRVLDALANLLRTDASKLEEAAEFRGIVGPEASAVYMRSDDIGVAAVAPDAAAAPGEPDEVDLLFTGGR